MTYYFIPFRYTSAGQEMVEEELESKSAAMQEAEDKMQLLGIAGDVMGSAKVNGVKG